MIIKNENPNISGTGCQRVKPFNSEVKYKTTMFFIHVKLEIASAIPASREWKTPQIDVALIALMWMCCFAVERFYAALNSPNGIRINRNIHADRINPKQIPINWRQALGSLVHDMNLNDSMRINLYISCRILFLFLNRQSVFLEMNKKHCFIWLLILSNRYSRYGISIEFVWFVLEI